MRSVESLHNTLHVVVWYTATRKVIFNIVVKNSKGGSIIFVSISQPFCSVSFVAVKRIMGKNLANNPYFIVSSSINPFSF